MSYTYHKLWQKMAVLASLQTVRDINGKPFHLQSASQHDVKRCLGISYNSVWSWINKGTEPRVDTIVKIVEKMNAQLALNKPITDRDLSDGASDVEFAMALGATQEDAKTVAYSIAMQAERLFPLGDFFFPDETLASDIQEQFCGLYEIERRDPLGKKDKTKAFLAMSIGNIIREDTKRHYVSSRLLVPATGSGEENATFEYDGIFCRRSGALFWVFSQKKELYSDFIFMITFNFNHSKKGASAIGKLITMGQGRPDIIARDVVVKRIKKGVSDTTEIETFLRATARITR